MALIDDFARREDITKAAVITRALDCMQASYDAGNGGMPITSAGGGGGSSAEVEQLKEQLREAQRRAGDAERRADAAEAKLRDASNANSGGTDERVSAAAQEEINRLRSLVEKQSATLEEKIKALAAKEEGSNENLKQIAAKDAEIASKDAALAERDSRIMSLNEQVNTLRAHANYSGNMGGISGMPQAVQPITFDASTFTEESPVGAISMLNMLNSVMAAFKQQVKDARILGEEEGRKAYQHEFEDVLNKARNDGYRDAMTYLDDRVTSAREGGAKEERARIANMSFFERRRYLRIHLA